MQTDEIRGSRAAVVWPRGRLVLGGALASALCLLALAARCEFVGRNALVFLSWNLLLAWIPLLFNVLASAVRWVHPKLRGPALVLDFAWLMFLPNAPYLVTDLVHLTQRPPVPIWFDVLFFSGFAATGCWLGLVSLEAVLARFKTRSIRLLTATIVCVLCGYGVYLGRFRRLNSWDILDDPFALMRLVLQPVFDPLAHPRALGFTFAFAVFFGVQWLLFAASTRPREA